jgi:DNA primase
MDVITAYQHGFKNVVATSGTALTKDQVKLLKRYTNNIALAFDMDAAGEQAARRGAREAMLAEMSIKIISLPKGSDPDDLIRKDLPAWQRAIESAENMMSYYLDLALRDRDLTNIDDKRLITKEFLPLIAQLGSKIEQDHWLKQLAQAIQISENILRETLGIMKKPPGDADEEPQEESPRRGRLSREDKMAEIFIALLIKFNELIEHAANNINVYHISGDVFKTIYKNLILFYNKIQEENSASDENVIANLSYENLREFIENNEDDNKNQLKALEKLVLLGDKDYYDYSVDQARVEIINIILYLKKNYLLIRLKEVENLIAQSEKEQDKIKAQELMKEFKILVEEFRGLGE